MKNGADASNTQDEVDMEELLLPDEPETTKAPIH